MGAFDGGVGTIDRHREEARGKSPSPVGNTPMSVSAAATVTCPWRALGKLYGADAVPAQWNTVCNLSTPKAEGEPKFCIRSWKLAWSTYGPVKKQTN